MPPKAKSSPIPIPAANPAKPITHNGLVAIGKMPEKELSTIVQQIGTRDKTEEKKPNPKAKVESLLKPEGKVESLLLPPMTEPDQAVPKLLGTMSGGTYTSVLTAKLKAKHKTQQAEKALESSEKKPLEVLDQDKPSANLQTKHKPALIKDVTLAQPTISKTKQDTQLKTGVKWEITVEAPQGGQVQAAKHTTSVKAQKEALKAPKAQDKSDKKTSVQDEAIYTESLGMVAGLFESTTDHHKIFVTDGSDEHKKLPVIEERDDIAFVRDANFWQLQNYILTGDIANLAANLKGTLWQIVSTSVNLNGVKIVDSLTRNILEKIAIYQESKNIRNDNELVQISPEIAKLKVDTLLYQKQNILKILTRETEQVIIKRTAEENIKQIEEAYLLYRLLEQKNPNTANIKELIAATSKTLNDIIAAVTDQNAQFDLFKLALSCREANFSDDHVYLTDLLIKLGSYGVTLPEETIKFEAVRYNQKAYSIIYKQPKLEEVLTCHLADLLTNMNKIAIAFFSDKGHADIYAKHIEYLGHAAPAPVEAKLSMQKSSTDLTPTALKPLVPIIISGLSNDLELQIKKQIQVNVLDKIQAAAAKGKWTELSLSRTEQGVCGYLDQKWLSTQLGLLASEEGSYETALSLCFEAINIGIMNSTKRDYSCAVIFSQKYPKIVERILEQHPEYFVDGYVLKVSQLSANIHSPRLMGQELKLNEGGYNHYFEEEMHNIINSRIKQAILEPIGNIVRNKQWNKQIESVLLGKLDQAYIKSVIGNNLSTIEDVFSIVRIMAFDVLVKTTLAESSPNYAPIAVFASQYKDLIIRIKTDHAELLNDSNISSWVDKTVGSYSLAPNPSSANPVAVVVGAGNSDSKSEAIDPVNPTNDITASSGGIAGAASANTTNSGPVGYLLSMFSRSSSSSEAEAKPVAQALGLEVKVSVAGEVGSTE